MKVLVTGAAGFIGRATTRLLVGSGHDVLGVDVRPLPVDPRVLPAVGERFRWERLDIRQGRQVRASLSGFGPDAVVHLAARHFIPWCDRFPAATLRTNVLGTQNVVDALHGLDAETRLVFASSAAVYGPSRAAIREDATLRPDDIYGTSKVICERLLELALARDLCSSVVVLRLFNAVGPGDANAHLVPRLISELRREGARVRVGNLTSVRDYVNVEDVARAIVAAVGADLPQPLTVANIGTGVGRSVGDVVQALGVLVGRSLEVVSLASRRRAVDRPLLVADPSHARAALGWQARIPFETGLAVALRTAGLPLASDAAPGVEPVSAPAVAHGEPRDGGRAAAAPRALAGGVRARH
jgi:UDP-glucose 4-epimerase